MVRRTLNLPFSRAFTASAAGSTLDTADLLSVMTSDALIETRPGMTIVRIRGHVGFKSATIAISQDRIHLAFMLMDRGETDVQSPGAQVLNAFARIDGLTSGLVVEDAAGSFEATITIYPIDSRGMRKIDRIGQEIRMMVNVPTAIAIEVQAVGTIRVMME